MIVLITGIPGAGKTLNTIRMVRDLSVSDNRAVYFNHIDELSPDLGWSELDDSSAKRWFELPHGAVILLDEVHHLFPTRPVGSVRPEHIAKLTEHRHFGHDIYLVTQHPKLIDADVRKLVGKHIHVNCPLGKGVQTFYEWTECQGEPRDYHAKQAALISTRTVDKSIFKLYKSAEIHTVKLNLPWFKIIFMFSCIVVIVGLGLLVWHNMNTVSKRTLAGTAFDPSAKPVTSNTGLPSSAADVPKLSWAEMSVPRIFGMPWTEPKYDQISQPKSRPFPKACIKSAVNCLCYTDQATKLPVSYDFCIAYLAAGGLYDDTRLPLSDDKPPPTPVTPSQIAHNDPVITSQPVPATPLP